MQSNKLSHPSEPQLAQDLRTLKKLSTFLRLTFNGARFGDFKIDEAVEALDRVVHWHELEKK